MRVVSSSRAVAQASSKIAALASAPGTGIMGLVAKAGVPTFKQTGTSLAEYSTGQVSRPVPPRCF